MKQIPLDIPLTEIEPHQCRYPTDTRNGLQLFCGHPCVGFSPYCAEHHLLCRIPVKRKKIIVEVVV